jgi:hypothetical protein
MRNRCIGSDTRWMDYLGQSTYERLQCFFFLSLLVVDMAPHRNLHPQRYPWKILLKREFLQESELTFDHALHVSRRFFFSFF